MNGGMAMRYNKYLVLLLIISITVNLILGFKLKSYNDEINKLKMNVKQSFLDDTRELINLIYAYKNFDELKANLSHLKSIMPQEVFNERFNLSNYDVLQDYYLGPLYINSNKIITIQHMVEQKNIEDNTSEVIALIDIEYDIKDDKNQLINIVHRQVGSYFKYDKSGKLLDFKDYVQIQADVSP